jgi:hypothetical protein
MQLYNPEFPFLEQFELSELTYFGKSEDKDGNEFSIFNGNVLSKRQSRFFVSFKDRGICVKVRSLKKSDMEQVIKEVKETLLDDDAALLRERYNKMYSAKQPETNEEYELTSKRCFFKFFLLTTYDNYLWSSSEDYDHFVKRIKVVDSNETTESPKHFY